MTIVKLIKASSKFYAVNAIIIIQLFCYSCLSAQQDSTQNYWHNIPRSLHYKPDGEDFVTINGTRRFVRALYGTNTAFRVETGDLPEFTMYMPGMGGNLKFALINNDTSKWLINADTIIARYRAGSMLYEIKDKMLGKGKLYVSILALAKAEGMIVKLKFESVSTQTKLFWAFGGASGKKFSRDGDMGPDPESSFYLKPDYCLDNNYNIDKNSFTLKYGTGLISEADSYVNKVDVKDTIVLKKMLKEQTLVGIIPPTSSIKLSDATQQSSPINFLQSIKQKSPALTGELNIINDEFYFLIQKPDSNYNQDYSKLIQVYSNAETARQKIANRIKVVTPDKYINTIGGVISIATDAIWESPSYLHGAVGWRMRLNGWRGVYAADVLGWHDRAKTHFSSYALSQVTQPLTGPVVMDTALHLARSLEKMGTSVYSSGYISRNPNGDFRPHHYDMNLVFIDELLWHFKWTADTSFVKQMFPVIKNHLAWEKRNFDADGLYDAYAAIWASDALQYSGGSVTHSSAYNYRANKIAAELAIIINEDATPFINEANKIFNAVNKILWMPSKGSYAEYKDALGLQILHPNAALWTIYHSIDSDVPDAFKAYQSLKYIDNNIPHIPVKAKDLEDGYYTLSTSNWMPYDWSLNNVATAEVMHTSLANWKAGRSEEAFNLFKSELLATMYLGGSPGNIGQISFYDAIRGEAYRDFADPIGITARSLIQGLFGILPNVLHDELTIRPGFPSSWNNASLQTPDIKFDFKKNERIDTYTISPSFNKQLQLKLLLIARSEGIEKIIVNGKNIAWKNIDTSVGKAMIELNCGKQNEYSINIIWKEKKLDEIKLKNFYVKGDSINLYFPNAVVKEIYDPQKVFFSSSFNKYSLQTIISTDTGYKTAFIKIKQGEIEFWKSLDIHVKQALEVISTSIQKNEIKFCVKNNTSVSKNISIIVNDNFSFTAILQPYAQSKEIIIQADKIIPGSNHIICKELNEELLDENIIDWLVDLKFNYCEPVDISKHFNDKVTSIFKNQYLSPRPSTPTLQLPTQGIGDWTHPLKTVEINDNGLRKLAEKNNTITLPQGVSFSTPSDSSQKNILFTSQWDNYPKQINIPLTGNASHAYFLMAGSTNPMQTRIVNGVIQIVYIDGTIDSLELKNPQTWWPIEQDYFNDGYAFNTNATLPVRVHLKTGKIISEYDNSIKNYNGKMIEGGAATVFDLPLQKNKTLKELRLKTIANDVVIGLMSITLIR